VNKKYDWKKKVFVKNGLMKFLNKRNQYKDMSMDQYIKILAI